MSIIDSLEKYTIAAKAVDTHVAENKGVFDKHQSLVFALIDAEGKLRDDAAEAKEGATNGDYKVVVNPQTQTYADIEVIDALIAGGVIPASKRAEIVKTVERPLKITISKQK